MDSDCTLFPPSLLPTVQHYYTLEEIFNVMYCTCTQIKSCKVYFGILSIVTHRQASELLK
jgi:hypothetical protein